MSSNERTSLLSRRKKDEKDHHVMDTVEFRSPLNRAGRSASVGALGGSSSLGTFTVPGETFVLF